MKRGLILLAVLCMLMTAGAQAVQDSVLVAEDFCFTTAEGSTQRLRELPNDRLTLLVFYDPDCRDCRQLLFALRHSTVVSQRVGEQLLQVVTVDVGENRRLTRRMQRELPDTWMKASLQSDLSQSQLYDTSAVPMLYLLDADQRVMLADNDVQQLNTILAQLW